MNTALQGYPLTLVNTYSDPNLALTLVTLGALILVTC